MCRCDLVVTTFLKILYSDDSTTEILNKLNEQINIGLGPIFSELFPAFRCSVF